MDEVPLTPPIAPSVLTLTVLALSMLMLTKELAVPVRTSVPAPALKSGPVPLLPSFRFVWS